MNVETKLLTFYPKFAPNFITPFLAGRKVLAPDLTRLFPSDMSNINQESPPQTKPKKGPTRKVHEFRPFL